VSTLATAANAHPETPIDARRNIGAIVFDISTFVSGIAFIPSATVIVGLASKLTDSKTLISVAAMIFTVAWYLPQLVAARLVRGRPKQRPFVLIASLIGRPIFLLIALWLFLTRAADPGLTLWIVIIGIALFNICDAIAGVAWFDIVSRVLSPRVRARVMTAGQVISGIVGLGISEIIKRVLASPDLPFPLNYGVLFLCTFLFMAVSTIALVVLRERPMQVVEAAANAQGSFWSHLMHALRTNPLLQRIVFVRLLTGIEAMAASFYLVFAKERYSMADAVEGNFTQAIIVGGLAGVALFGWIAERFTSRRVVHLSSIFYFATPGLAALCALFEIPASIAYLLFVGVFLMRGALEHCLILGLVGYLLDTTPERDRAMFVGGINTLGGVVSATPLLGGLFIDSFGVGTFQALPYALLFGMVTLTTLAGFLVSLRLPAVKPV
jgi:MFS family permease